MSERAGKKKWICYALKKAAELGILLAVILSYPFSAMAAENGRTEDTAAVDFQEENDEPCDLPEPGKGEETAAPEEPGAGEEGGGPDAGTGNESEDGSGAGEGSVGDGTESGAGEEGSATEGDRETSAEDGTESGAEAENGDQVLKDGAELLPGAEAEAVLLTEAEIMPLAVDPLADMGPDAVVTTPEELYKWGIECTDGVIKAVIDTSQLPDHLKIPEGVTSIDGSAFKDMDSTMNFTKVTLPNSLEKVSQAAFMNCEKLETIVLGSGIKKLGMQAFLNCDSIKYVDMSKAKNLEEVLFGAFSNNPANEIETLHINSKYFLNNSSENCMLDGANVKKLIVEHDNAISASSEIEAALYLWKAMMAAGERMRLNKASLREGEVRFSYNGSPQYMNVKVYEQRRLIAESYFMDDGFQAKTAGDLWAVCFGEDSAKKATICMLTDQTGEGVMEAASFMQFYNLEYKDNRADVYFADSSAKMDEVYDKLLQQLTSEATVLEDDLVNYVTISETSVATAEAAATASVISGEIQQAVPAAAEVQETMAASVPAASAVSTGEEEQHAPAVVSEIISEPMPEGAEPADIAGAVEVSGIAEAAEMTGAPEAVEPKTEQGTGSESVQEPPAQNMPVSSPGELYRWGIICQDGVVSGVSDSSLLPEVLVLPEGVTKVGGLAGQSGIREVVLPDSVEVVDPYAFMNCTGLERVTFGSGIRQIQTAAFLGCGSIQTVDLSRASQLEQMGEAAFGMPMENGSAVIGQLNLNVNILNGGSCVNALWNVQVQSLFLTQ